MTPVTCPACGGETKIGSVFREHYCSSCGIDDCFGAQSKAWQLATERNQLREKLADREAKLEKAVAFIRTSGRYLTDYYYRVYKPADIDAIIAELEGK